MNEKPYYEMTIDELRGELKLSGIRVPYLLRSDIPSNDYLQPQTPEKISYSLYPIRKEIYLGKTIRIPDSIVTITELINYLNSQEIRMEITLLRLETSGYPLLILVMENIDAWTENPILIGALRLYHPTQVKDQTARALLLGKTITEDQMRSFIEELEDIRKLQTARIRWLSLLLLRSSQGTILRFWFSRPATAWNIIRFLRYHLPITNWFVLPGTI